MITSLLTSRWAQALIVVIALAAALVFTYNRGYAKAKLESELQLSAVMRTEAEERERLQAVARGKEAIYRQEVSRIEQEGYQNVQKAQNESVQTITALRDGTLRLRERLAAFESSGSTAAAQSNSGMGSGRGVETRGLRIADAEFLVRESDRADARAEALKTCVAIGQKDRAMMADWYKEYGTKTP